MKKVKDDKYHIGICIKEIRPRREFKEGGYEKVETSNGRKHLLEK